MRFWPRRIDSTVGVDPARLEAARTAAEAHADPVLPSLPFTESNPDWTLLYDHARLGQIDPRVIRRMRVVDLEYLGGMTQPHPDMLTNPKGRDELSKLLGNVARATRELQRRSAMRTGIISASLGAFVATVVTLLAS